VWVQPCSFACPSVCLMMWFQCRQVHSFIFMEFYGLSTLRPSIHSLSQLHFENYWRLHKRFNLHWDDREIGFGFKDYTLELNKIFDNERKFKDVKTKWYVLIEIRIGATFTRQTICCIHLECHSFDMYPQGLTCSMV